MEEVGQGDYDFFFDWKYDCKLFYQNERTMLPYKEGAIVKLSAQHNNFWDFDLVMVAVLTFMTLDLEMVRLIR